MTVAIDPQHLLDSLVDSLDLYGGVKSAEHSKKFLKLLQGSSKLVSKCIYLNVLRSTSCEEARLNILSSGAWNLLYDWLKEAESQGLWPLVSELLNTFIEFPLTIDLLRLNNSPKIIRRLSKRLDVDSEIRRLAADIVFIWKDLIIDESLSASAHSLKLDSNSNLPVFPNYQNSIVNKRSVLSEQQIQQQMMQHGSIMSIDPNIDLEEEHDDDDDFSSSSISGENSDVTAENPPSLFKFKATKASLKSYSPPPRSLGGVQSKTHSVLAPKTQTTSPGNLFEKLDPSERERFQNYQNLDKKSVFADASLKRKFVGDFDADERNRGKKSTAKTFSSKLKSTGLDSEPESMLKKFKIPKKSSAQISVPPSVASAAFPAVNHHALPKIIEPTIHHHRSKEHRRSSVESVAPAKPTTPTLSSPSTGMTSSSLNAANVVKQTPPSRPTVDADVKRTTPTSRPPPLVTSLVENSVASVSTTGVTSPTSTTVAAPSIVVAKLKQPTPAKSAQLIESDTFMAALEGNSAQKLGVIRKKKIVLKPSVAVSNSSSSVTSTSSTSASFYRETMRATSSNSAVVIPSQQPNDQSNVDASSGVEGTKKVKWAKENDLVQIQYFEVDESERINFNRIRMFGDYKHFEMHREREFLEAARRGYSLSSSGETFMPWNLVPCENGIKLVEHGCKSNEKKVQAERQSSILTEVYLPGMLLPETPKEPELMDRIGQQEPFIIPLDDVSNSHQTTQLPPELNRLLEGLKQSGMMPAAGSASSFTSPANFFSSSSAPTSGAAPNFIMPSNVPVMPPLPAQSGMTPQQVALLQQLRSTPMPPQQQQQPIVPQQPMQRPPLLPNLQQQVHPIPFVPLQPPTFPNSTAPVSQQPMLSSAAEIKSTTAPVFTGGPTSGPFPSGDTGFAAAVNMAPAPFVAAGPPAVPQMPIPPSFMGAGLPPMLRPDGPAPFVVANTFGIKNAPITHQEQYMQHRPQEMEYGGYDESDRRFDGRRSDFRDNRESFHRKRDDSSNHYRRGSDGVGRRSRFDDRRSRFSDYGDSHSEAARYRNNNNAPYRPPMCRDFFFNNNCMHGLRCRFSHDEYQFRGRSYRRRDGGDRSYDADYAPAERNSPRRDARDCSDSLTAPPPLCVPADDDARRQRATDDARDAFDESATADFSSRDFGEAATASANEASAISIETPLNDAPRSDDTAAASLDISRPSVNQDD